MTGTTVKLKCSKRHRQIQRKLLDISYIRETVFHSLLWESKVAFAKLVILFTLLTKGHFLAKKCFLYIYNHCIHYNMQKYILCISAHI